jgi:hypothetical protein
MDDKDVIKQTVIETLTALGANASDPESIIALQKDFSFLRSVREAFWKGAMAIVSAAIAIASGAVAAYHSLFPDGHHN